jgi:hypothetical protein
MALPASEYTGVLLAADAVSNDCFTATPGLCYRKWPGQATNQGAHVESGERTARMHIIQAHALALLRIEKTSHPS